ncbi:hypothetical protein [Paraflavitalea speifideaquila]|uniref:hypothetical protein n=1 Tax=Paraflavitalea speifideaquila TaxID=3076558 RepID=UPI0028F04A18|nr:hypothetical protein [Paraflavitalea speifideiaquila]
MEREKLTANLFFAVQMGRYFLRLIKQKALDAWIPGLLTKYQLNYTIDKNDAEGIQLMAASKDLLPDGFILHVDTVTMDGPQTRFEKWMNDNAIPNGDQTIFKDIVLLFQRWHERNYSQPDPAIGSAWLPQQLEYQFAVAGAQQQQQQKVLTADQYAEGHLDWYSFDLNPGRSLPLDPEPAGHEAIENFVSFIPAPIAFKGMPNPRFWTMEENQTDFGKIDTTPTGAMHLLLAEFGLIYSNDWFMLPYTLDVNTLCEIKGMTITDVFGQHILIRPAGRGAQTNWHKWAMFQHTNTANKDSNSNLYYLTPSITKALEGDPLEQVNFLRDEMANMVWAVENTVPSQAGKGVSGNEMALKESQPAPFVPVANAPIRYVLGTTVPGNWIPFIPVHIEGSDTEIRLQRAAMPGAKGALGVILKEKPAPYYVNEEEVPRAGIIVERSFQRTRWFNGSTFLWIGRFKEACKGEGWSNLKFDQIEDILPKNP